MAVFNAILIIELFCQITSSRILLPTLTAFNLYCIAYDCYTATIFALLLIFTVNCPYFYALLRLLQKPDSVNRRRVFLDVCVVLFTIKFAVDFYVVLGSTPVTKEICEAAISQEPELFDFVKEINE